MQDNTLFTFFKPPHAPTGSSSSLMWIQMQEHTVCCKDIGFLWGASALWNLILTEFVILLTLAQGKWFEEIFIAHMCDLAWDASIQYRFGADGVLWALGMCQYCHRAKTLLLSLNGNIELVLVCHAYNIIFAVFCWLHYGCPHYCRWKILLYLFSRHTQNVSESGTLLSKWSCFCFLFFFNAPFCAARLRFGAHACV